MNLGKWVRCGTFFLTPQGHLVAGPSFNLVFFFLLLSSFPLCFNLFSPVPIFHLLSTPPFWGPFSYEKIMRKTRDFERILRYFPFVCMRKQCDIRNQFEAKHFIVRSRFRWSVIVVHCRNDKCFIHLMYLAQASSKWEDMRQCWNRSPPDHMDMTSRNAHENLIYIQFLETAATAIPRPTASTCLRRLTLPFVDSL